MSNPQDEREDFEDWMRRDHPGVNLMRRVDGSYWSEVPDAYLEGWNARAALANQRAEAGVPELSLQERALAVAEESTRIMKMLEERAVQPEAVPQDSPHRPSPEWYRSKIAETLDDDFVIGPAVDPEAVPQGGQWRVVPYDPTTGMLVAGNHCQPGDYSAKLVYQQMLDAADRSAELSYLRPRLAPPPSPQPPAAQAIPKCHVAVIGFHFDGDRQHHVPQLLIEFDPVPVGAPNDAKGWEDRDRLASLLMSYGIGTAKPAPERVTQDDKVAEVERMLERFIEQDPDAAERFIESQLAQLALRKRLAARRAGITAPAGGGEA